MSILRRVYHGTVDTWIPDIMRLGLRYTPLNKWRTKLKYGYMPDYEPDKDDPPGYVYIADRDTAKTYAQLKAAYLHAKPCETIVQHDFDIAMVKDCDAPVIPSAKPVILSIDVAAIDKSLTQWDPGSSGAIRYRGSIDPKYIKVLRVAG